MKKITTKIISSLLVLTMILLMVPATTSAIEDDEVVVTHVKTWDQLKEALERGDKNIQLNNTEPMVATSDINVALTTNNTIEIVSVVPDGISVNPEEIDNSIDINFTNYSINFYAFNPDLKANVRFQDIDFSNYINPCVVAKDDNITLVRISCNGDNMGVSPFEGSNVIPGKYRSYLDVEVGDIAWTDIECVNLTLPENATGTCLADIYVIPTASPEPSESPDPFATPGPSASPFPYIYYNPTDPEMKVLTPEEFGQFWGLSHYRTIGEGEDDSIEITDGRSRFEVTDFIPGSYVLYSRYYGDDNYEPAYNSVEFDVIRLNSLTTVSAQDGYYGKPETITFEVTGNDNRQPFTGMVDVELEKYNESTHSYKTLYSKKAGQTDGNGSVTLSGLEAGDYRVTARYEGDTYYNDSEDYDTFKITYENTYDDISINANSSYSYGETPVIEFVPPAGATGDLDVEVYYITTDPNSPSGDEILEPYYSVKNPENNKIELPDIQSGSYRIYASMVHDNVLSYGSVTIRVSKVFLGVNVSTENIYHGEPASIYVTANGYDNKKISGIFNIYIHKLIKNQTGDGPGGPIADDRPVPGERVYSGTVNVVNGEGSISVDGLDVGEYAVIAEYPEDRNYNESAVQTDLKVEPAPTPTPTATPEPTAVPTPEPTTEPTAVPTTEPTAAPEPTAVPTLEPTTEPTAVPTTEPTAAPTAVPTSEPSPEPKADAAEVEKTILKAKTESDLKGSRYSIIQLKQDKVKKNSIRIKWKKVNGAKKYVVYGGKCGRFRKYKKITTTKKTFYTYKKLKKGTYYKMTIVALDANNKVISLAKLVHIVTDGAKKGNDKAVKINTNKVSVAVGNTYKLKGKEVVKSKKLPVMRHRVLSFESDKPSIAEVDKNGVIKGVSAGTCIVYVFSQNGFCKEVRVTVQ